MLWRRRALRVRGRGRVRLAPRVSSFAAGRAGTRSRTPCRTRRECSHAEDRQARSSQTHRALLVRAGARQDE
eukprot:3246920-Pleurochrysis_carterae.AAC.1